LLSPCTHDTFIGVLRALMILVPLAISCGGRGSAGFGESCDSDDACAAGLCVGGVSAEGPVCTKSCASSEECPEGWSCSAATENGVVVCRQGSATPFGQ